MRGIVEFFADEEDSLFRRPAPWYFGYVMYTIKFLVYAFFTYGRRRNGWLGCHLIASPAV